MKNEYKFKYDGELIFIQNLIKKYNKKYLEIKLKCDNKVKEIDNYFDMIKLMEEYRLEILNLLKKIIEKYPFFENNAVIYLTGSFARHTVRPFSDLDLNVVYVRGSGKKYEKYEELFYYMISEIFKYPRRAIHSIITAFNNKENIKFVQQNMDEEDIIVTLIDKDLTIKYKIPYLSKKRFYLQYLNDKNYKTVFKNLKKINDNDGVQEWSNNFLFLNENRLVIKYYEDYISYILKNINWNKINKYYNQIINELSNEILDFSYIKNIKIAIQMNELHFIYNSITILQLLIVIKQKGRFYNSFEDIINNTNENLKKIIMYFYKYNYKLIHLNLIFEKYNLEYSIHTNQKIDLNQYPVLKKEIDHIIGFMNNINKKILKILKGEMNIYDK